MDSELEPPNFSTLPGPPVVTVDDDGSFSLAAFRYDGWSNLLQGFGRRGRDASVNDRPMPPEELASDEYDWLYRGEALAARVVDLLPAEATREGWRLRVDRMAKGEDVQAEEANEIADGMVTYCRRLKAKKRVRQGFSLGRLHGGALIVIGIDDGQEFSQPVNEGAIKGVRWLQALKRHAVVPGSLETDVRSEYFGEPRTYSVTLEGMSEAVEIHASRVIRMSGAWSPTSTGSTGAHEWDDPVLLKMRKALADLAMTVQSISKMTRDFSRVRMAIKDFAQKMRGNGINEIRTRVEGGELAASVLNAYLHDPAENVDYLTRQVNGLADLFDRQAQYVAACTGYPITLLLGVSPGGLGTGEDEDKRWTNNVKAFQEDEVLIVWETIARYILLAKDGPTGGRLPDKWAAIFNPLRSPSAKEVAEIRNLIILALKELVAEGVLLPHEVAESLFGRGEWSMDVTLDRETRDAMKEAELLGEEEDDEGDNKPPPDDEDEGDDA